MRDTGPVRVAFPSKNWVRTEPPAALLQWSATNAGFKLLYYAESAPSKLKLHVTQFDYPPSVTSAQLSGFVANLKRRYQTSAMGAVAEKSRTVAGLPAIELEGRYPGWAFVSSRIYFCAARAYLVEVGGPGDFQAEAMQCLNGVSLTGEQGLASASVASLNDIRRKATAPVVPPQQRGHDRRVVIEGVVIVCLAVGGVAVAMWIGSVLRRRAAQAPKWDTGEERL